MRIEISMVGRMWGSCVLSTPSLSVAYVPGAAGGQARRQQCTHGRRGSPRLGQASAGSARKSRRAGAALCARAYKTGSRGEGVLEEDAPLSPQAPQQPAVPPCLWRWRMGPVWGTQSGNLKVPQWAGPQPHRVPDRAPGITLSDAQPPPLTDITNGPPHSFT